MIIKMITAKIGKQRTIPLAPMDTVLREGVRRDFHYYMTDAFISHRPQ
jgi:hypothetical protein